jgi:hypothetical protein
MSPYPTTPNVFPLQASAQEYLQHGLPAVQSRKDAASEHLFRCKLQMLVNTAPELLNIIRLPYVRLLLRSQPREVLGKPVAGCKGVLCQGVAEVALQDALVKSTSFQHIHDG